jgi:uncharacterized protein involved in response to NO
MKTAFLEAGFRPMFLAAGAWSALAVAIWLAALVGVIEIPSVLDPRAWHAHEMLFGFVLAAIGGFLLTAIPNWTGRNPVSGTELGLLALAWLAGRVAMFVSGYIGAEAAAVIDLAYPVALTAIAAREIVAGGNLRNLPVAGLIGLLTLSDMLVHVEALGWADTALLGLNLAIALVALLVSLIGGRVVPAFTRNWLKARGDDDGPAAFGLVDRLAILLTALAGPAWAVFPDRVETAWLALACGLMHFARVMRWRGARSLAAPLLWVLHLAYLWLATGFMLIGLAVLVPGIPPSAALHALTGGAFGTMILAVMSRASLGHAGRELVAGNGTVACYVLVTLAVVLRVTAPLFPSILEPLFAAALFWIAAYGLFTVLYLPIFLQPKPGDN